MKNRRRLSPEEKLRRVKDFNLRIEGVVIGLTIALILIYAEPIVRSILK